MRVQEQAFRSYYASKSDAEILAIAANRSSFIELAQQILAEELSRRHLTLPAETAPAAAAAGPLRRLLRTLRHHEAHN